MSFLKKLFLLLGILSVAVSAQERKIPNYSTTPRKDVPVEFKWKLEDIYPTKDAWYQDKNSVMQMMDKVEALQKDWTTTPQKMLAVFQLSEEINKKFGRLFNYAGHSANVELSNTDFQKMKGEIQSAAVKAGVKFSFMNDDLLKMPEDQIWKYLKEEPGLKPYRFSIEQILRARAHILPLEQEQILTQTGLFSSANETAANLLNNVEIPSPEVTLSDGSKITLNYANYSVHRGDKVPADRTLVMSTFFKNQKNFENTMAALLDGEMKKHLFEARVRKYPDCLSAKLYGDNIDTSVYLNLVKMVRENLGPMHRYLKLKQELLGLETMRYEDMYASALKNVDKQFSYDEAKDIVMNAVKPLGTEYNTVLASAFKKGWIDVYPNKDKESGAYSSGVYGVHPFVKMNFDGEYDGVSTLAHELGHSMHSYFSYKTQPYSDAFYPIFLAEVASTFNENLLMDYMLKNEKDDMFKLYILDKYIDGIRATIYRQSLFAEFELAMHRKVEAGESLTADWLDATYLDLVKKYYSEGDGKVLVGDFIQNEWSIISHFYMNYYVFQYSTGMIASLALTEKVLNEGPEYRDKYLAFLSSGGNDYPINILKKAGIDMTSADPYNAAFKKLSDYVTEMEKLTAKLKKEKRL